MTLKEKVKDCIDIAKMVQEQYPTMTDCWFALEDIPIEELREAQTELQKMYYSESHKKMVVQNPYRDSDRTSGVTIFARSKEVKVKQHVVIEDIIENV